MTTSYDSQTKQVQQSMDTGEEDSSLKLFTRETYNSLPKAYSEE